MTDAIHKFERAGLGKAPFYCVGYSHETYQAVPGDPNCPIQPGASCDYCGQAISDVFHVLSADGRRFKVGSTCIYKAGDAGLKRYVNKEKRAKQLEREDARIEAAREYAGLEEVRDELARRPHPYKRFEGTSLTALDFVDWMLERGGHKGKMDAVRFLDKFRKEG